MKRLMFAMPLVAGLVALSSQAASAKTPTIKITISGGRLGRTITITDRSILDRSDVYIGNFLDTTRVALDRAPSGSTRYEITYYIAETLPAPLDVSWLGRTKATKAYVVYYEPDAAEGRGYVYLPGSNEAPRINQGTIIRPGLDGRWVSADRTWDSLIKAAIARQQPPR